MKSEISKKSKQIQTPSQEPNALLQAQVEEISRNVIKQCELLLAVYVLKATSNEEFAMSVSEIADQLNILIPDNDPDNSFFPERTLRRKFDIFSLLEESKGNAFDQIFQLLAFVYGGRVVSREADGIVSGKNKNAAGFGKQKRFYFDPILSEGDMDLIYGTIQSSRYLSDQEKHYLLSRLRVLQPSYDLSSQDIKGKKNKHLFQVDSLPARPRKDKLANLPVETSVFLSHIQTVHDAIENEYQIEVIYGTYDADAKGKVSFHARNPERPYILNPYAMMWNDGDYYLLATHGDYTNPTHFRMDRIVSVRPHTEKNKDGIKSEIKRKKIPQTLQPYFKRTRNGLLVFDAIKYANTFPEMKIYSESHLVDCVFECTSASLQILIDYFGTDIKLKPSPIKHDPAEVDRKGNPIAYFAAEVKNVQYENALSFSIMLSERITLLAPASLVDDVRSKFEEILDRYRRYGE